jgi:hypothetical protein
VKLEGTRQRLAKIVGEPLSAVTFVRDYVQLHFDGPTISAFTLPTVTVRGKTIAFADPGYRDALCARIGLGGHPKRIRSANRVPDARRPLA